MLIDRPSVNRSVFNRKDKLDNYILMKVENLCVTYSTGMQLRWTKDCWGNPNIFYSVVNSLRADWALLGAMYNCTTGWVCEDDSRTTHGCMDIKIWPCRLTQYCISCHDEDSVGLSFVFLIIVQCCPSSYSIAAKIVKTICKIQLHQCSPAQNWVCRNLTHVLSLGM